MVDAVLHVLLQFGPEDLDGSEAESRREGGEVVVRVGEGQKGAATYPNSRSRLLAAAVAAFPPPYLFTKSSLIRSRKAMGTCLPTDSTATTQ